MVRPLLLQALAKLYGDECVRCHEHVDITLPGFLPDGPTLDHVQPWCLDGRDEIENVRLAHHRCNSLAGGNLVQATGTGRPAVRRIRLGGSASPAGMDPLW